jgi:hypothetical protein
MKMTPDNKSLQLSPKALCRTVVLSSFDCECVASGGGATELYVMANWGSEGFLCGNVRLRLGRSPTTIQRKLTMIVLGK